VVGAARSADSPPARIAATALGQEGFFQNVAYPNGFGATSGMHERGASRLDETSAVSLLRRLRRIDQEVGVRNSGIAFDVGLLLYEQELDAPARHMSVDMITAKTAYSGPTVRLVLKRLIEAGAVEPTRRVGKTQLYGLTARGMAGFQRYIRAVLGFRAGMALSQEGGSEPGADPPGGPAPPPARYGDGPSDPAEGA
jgi:DNA-binding transcriptional ArsR family regulator